MQPINLSGAQLFSRHIFPFEILTFIEIIIDITTGGLQLKIRFLFLIVYKYGLFHILGFSSNKKKKKKKTTTKKKKKLELQAFYCLQHFLVVYLLKCYLVSFSRYKQIQTIL